MSDDTQTDVQDYKRAKVITAAFWSVLWLTVLVLLVLKFVVFQQVTVVGNSMKYINNSDSDRGYQDGQILVVNQFNKDFERGDVVAVYAEEDVAREANYFTRFTAKFFLKRIIGLPGESIEIAGGNIIIYNDDYPQGAVLEENYISSETIETENSKEVYFPRTKIPESEYFLLGDNRSNSTDSRVKGTFPDYSIFGIESFRLWPFRFFEEPSYSFTPVSDDLNDYITSILSQ